MACYRHQQPVRISRVHRDLGDLLPVTQSQMGPGLARIARLIDPISHRKIRTLQPFAAADVDDVRIGDRHRDRTHGTGWLLIEDGYPVAAVIRRLPYPSVDRRHVKDIRLARDPRHRARPPASQWPYVAPVH